MPQRKHTFCDYNRNKTKNREQNRIKPDHSICEIQRILIVKDLFKD